MNLEWWEWLVCGVAVAVLAVGLVLFWYMDRQGKRNLDHSHH